MVILITKTVRQISLCYSRELARWEQWTPVQLLEEETHQQRNHQQITTEEGEEGGGSHTNLNPGLIWKYNKIVEKLLRTNNRTRVREKPQNLVHTEEWASTQTVHICTTEYKTWWMEWPSINQLEGRTHQRKTQQQSKPKDIQRANINDSPRTESSGN